MPLPSYSDHARAPSAIQEADLRRVVQMLDSILAVFGSYRERLKVSEVRLQSMFTALRMDMVEELGRRNRSV
jgi:hypothetical protein